MATFAEIVLGAKGATGDLGIFFLYLILFIGVAAMSDNSPRHGDPEVGLTLRRSRTTSMLSRGKIRYA
jgi:hypothetical protein